MFYSLFSFSLVWYFLLLLFILCFLLIVAYFTLLERKVMGSMQLRNGPDYVGFFGLLQPIADALKLLFKEFIIPQTTYSFIFIVSPILVFFFSLVMWFFLPLNHFGALFDSKFSVLWVLFVSSLSIYSLFLSGLVSGSVYAFLGSMRSVAQMLSYEISFVFLLIPVIFVSGSFSFLDIIYVQEYFGFSNYFWLFPNTILFFICLLAETNRAPFDLPEAEAELVAGYNVEYSSIPFALFFLGEYVNMLTMSTIFVILFFSGWSISFFSSENFFFFESILLFLKVFLVIFLIIWIRATLPRVRYDVLMQFSWKYSLLLSISYFFFFVSFYFILGGLFFAYV